MMRFCFVLFGLLTLAPAAAYSAPETGAASTLPPMECASTIASMSGAPCGTVTDTATYVAARTDPGQAAGPIDVWGWCRYVDNISTIGQSIFVPFKSSTEWQAFRTNYPRNTVSLWTCARPTTYEVLPSSACTSPSPSSYSLTLPYARTGTAQTSSFTFTCTTTGADCETNPSWTETATVTSTALNADLINPSWGQSVTYNEGSGPLECPVWPAHIFYYLLPSGIPGQPGVGSSSLIQAQYVVKNVNFDASSIDVSHIDGANMLAGFVPGQPDLAIAPQRPSWWGLCYDGGFEAPTDGVYTFESYVDDGTAIWIDGQLLYDDEYAVKTNYLAPDTGSPIWAPVRGDVFLSAGLHRVMVSYYQSYPLQEGLQYFVQYPGTGSAVVMPLVGPPGGTLSCPH